MTIREMIEALRNAAAKHPLGMDAVVLAENATGDLYACRANDAELEADMVMACGFDTFGDRDESGEAV